MTGLVIVVAGGVGAGLRFIVSDWVTRAASTELPWGTAAVNGLGALGLGLVLGLGVDGLAASGAVGGLSGFTTYSTWMVETVTLFDQGRTGRLRAFGNWLLPLGVGVVLAGVGWAIGGAGG